MAKKLFDFCIGNPPYQTLNTLNNRQEPVYNIFMDAAYSVSNVTELITPARFLFNAGQTPKAWNEKMLNDPHFKVIAYTSNASEIFPSTEIKGGVAITIRNEGNNYGPIGIFTEFELMNSALHKVIKLLKKSMMDIAVGAVPYKYSSLLKAEHPELIPDIGSSFDLRTNALDKMVDKLYFKEKPDDGEKYVRIFGLLNKKRTLLWVREDYITTSASNYSLYKVCLPKANGTGKFGEVLAASVISEPYVGHTQSFISLGACSTLAEAENLQKYIKTKFCRALLSVLKTTQDITPYKWKYVPLQDFSHSSDINWDKPIEEIDRQLYNKYGFSAEEIKFIETAVKKME